MQCTTSDKPSIWKIHCLDKKDIIEDLTFHLVGVWINHYSGVDQCGIVTWAGYENEVKYFAGIMVHETEHSVQDPAVNPIWRQSNPTMHNEFDANLIQDKFYKGVNLWSADTEEQEFENWVVGSYNRFYCGQMSTTYFQELFGHMPQSGTNGVSDNAVQTACTS